MSCVLSSLHSRISQSTLLPEHQLSSTVVVNCSLVPTVYSSRWDLRYVVFFFMIWCTRQTRSLFLSTKHYQVRCDFMQYSPAPMRCRAAGLQLSFRCPTNPKHGRSCLKYRRTLILSYDLPSLWRQRRWNIRATFTDWQEERRITNWLMKAMYFHSEKS
jgi:hypothetical protein